MKKMENVDRIILLSNCGKIISEGVSLLERDILTAILDETVDQLITLKILNETEIQEDHFENIVYKTVDERYGAAEYSSQVDKRDVVKIAEDIGVFINILKTVYDEIKTKRTFTTFTQLTNAITRMEEDDNQLLQQEREYRKEIRDIKQTLEKERLNNIKTLKTTNNKIHNAIYTLEDFRIIKYAEKKYFNKWEKARSDQNRLINERRENNFASIISDTKTKIDMENRCHSEIQRFLEQSKEDYLNDIEYWMKQYDNGMDQKDIEMVELKTSLEDQQEKFKALTKLYNEHKTFIEEWLEHKRIIKEKEDREALENWAATKIQAWWRGTMYRKKLGPYKKKRKRGKKGAKKNKPKGSKKSTTAPSVE